LEKTNQYRSGKTDPPIEFRDSARKGVTAVCGAIAFDRDTPFPLRAATRQEAAE
jgi:hypothetical protein